jgi:hypothetical protein
MARCKVVLRGSVSFTEPPTRGSKQWKRGQSEVMDSEKADYYRSAAEFIVSELRAPVKAKAKEPEPPPPSDALDEKSLSKMTKAELSDLALEKFDLDLGDMNKGEMVDAILEAQEDAEG